MHGSHPQLLSGGVSLPSRMQIWAAHIRHTPFETAELYAMMETLEADDFLILLGAIHPDRQWARGIRN